MVGAELKCFMLSIFLYWKIVWAEEQNLQRDLHITELPHILYGSKEASDLRAPKILPPFQNTYFDKYNPINGTVSVATDKDDRKPIFFNIRFNRI